MKNENERASWLLQAPPISPVLFSYRRVALTHHRTSTQGSATTHDTVCCAMEVMCRDELVTDALPLEVSVDATAAEVLRDACALFGREEEDMALEVDGVVWEADRRYVSAGSLGLQADSTVVLQRDRARVLAIADRWCSAMYRLSLPDWAWDDALVVHRVVRQAGNALRHASGDVQDNETVVDTAVSRNGYALQFASPRLRGDEAIVLKAVAQNADAIQYASAALRDSERVVGAAVAQNGRVLEGASARLQGNEAVVLQAVRQNAEALAFASASLRDNEVVVSAAVEQKGAALQYASPRLRNNEAIVLLAVRRDSAALMHASTTLRDNDAVVAAAVKKDKGAIIYASEQYRQRDRKKSIWNFFSKK
eukprot:Rhum_TRINITY_DN14943_c12_g3::Rhum_TRINITY_DN14943_c12_g3_i3::g.127423::m.127423